MREIDIIFLGLFIGMIKMYTFLHIVLTHFYKLMSFIVN